MMKKNVRFYLAFLTGAVIVVAILMAVIISGMKKTLVLEAIYKAERVHAYGEGSGQCVAFSKNSSLLGINTRDVIIITTGNLKEDRKEYDAGGGAISFNKEGTHLFLAKSIPLPVPKGLPATLNFSRRLKINEYNFRDFFPVNEFYVGKSTSGLNYSNSMGYFSSSEPYVTYLLQYGFSKDAKYIWTLNDNLYSGSNNSDFVSSNSPNERIVLTIYDIANRTKLSELTLKDKVDHLVISDDLSKIAYVTKHMTTLDELVILDLSTNNELRRVDAGGISLNWNIDALCFSPDGKSLAIGCDDDKVRLLDLSTVQNPNDKTLQNFSDVFSLYFSDDGKYLYSGNQNGQIIIYDLNDFSQLIKKAAHSKAIIEILASSDHNYMVSVGQDGTCILWSMKWQ